jgi:hypothetical protein
LLWIQTCHVLQYFFHKCWFHFSSFSRPKLFTKLRFLTQLQILIVSIIHRSPVDGTRMLNVQERWRTIDHIQSKHFTIVSELLWSLFGQSVSCEPSFTLPWSFLNGESPSSKGEWVSRKEIRPSKRINTFTLKGECVHPFWRVNLLSWDSYTLQKRWMEVWIEWITRYLRYSKTLISKGVKLSEIFYLGSLLI